MARRIVLLRHGLTSWNADGRYQGQADIDLAETGHQQAKAAARALKETHTFSRLFASDLQRTRQTAGYLAEETGLQVAYDARLREIHVGEVSGMTKPEIVARFGEMPSTWEPVGGESWMTVAARVRESLVEIADSLTEEETVAVVSHGGAIRHGLAAFLGWHDDVLTTLAPLDNCAWVELVDSSTHHGLIPSAPWRIATYGMGAPIS